MQPVSVALDWTPNTNHTGFYVARKKGYYSNVGVDVSILSPHTTDYKVTPASRLVDGSATFACTPSETIISYHTWPNGAKPKIVAVAALLQSNQSAVVTLKRSGISRPAQLDGKTYASYAARYEGRIVQSMIKADGGRGDYHEMTPPMLGIWDTLLEGTADATWVFLPWEGVAAQQAGVELNTFKLEDYGVSYGYSPVLAAHPDTLTQKPDLVRSFLAATAKGYAYAAQNPNEAANILLGEVLADTELGPEPCPLPEPLKPDMVRLSQQMISQHYLNPKSDTWGIMEMDQWSRFLDWLSKEGLLTSKVQSRLAAAAGVEDVAAGQLTTLDGLRSGDVGDVIPRDSMNAADLATNAYLPGKD